MTTKFINGQYYEMTRNGKTEIVKFGGYSKITMLFYFVNYQDGQFVMTWDMMADEYVSINHLDVLSTIMA